jgi:ribosomal protein L44E
MAKSLGIRYIKRYNKAELINEIINAEEQLKIKRENKKSLEIFPFDDAIFSKPKKKRVRKIKCDECGKYIKESRMQSRTYLNLNHIIKLMLPCLVTKNKYFILCIIIRSDFMK